MLPQDLLRTAVDGGGAARVGIFAPEAWANFVLYASEG